MEKSQTATEYIILVAVVLVIALIVVGVLGGIPGIGGQSGRSTNAVALSSASIGIVDYAFGTIGVKVTIKNNNLYPITISSAYLTTSLANFSKDLPLRLDIGESRTLESYSQSKFTSGAEYIDYFSVSWRDDKANVSYTNIANDYKLSGTVSSASVLRKSASYVFLSSTTNSGNLGNISGADAKCLGLANNASINRYPNSKQWVGFFMLSTQTRASRFKFNTTITLLNGSVVALNQDDLFTNDGGGQYISYPIERDENNVLVSPIEVLTGFTSFGTAVGLGFTCSDWTSASGMALTNNGYSSGTDSTWTESDSISCNQVTRIYCFEQY